MTHLETKRRAAEATGRLLNLIDTNFHSQGLIPPPEPFRRGFEDYLAQRRYRPDPQGDKRARESVAAFYRSRGLSVSHEDVILCASTSEAYSLLFSTFGRAGDSVAIPLPGYPLAEFLARQNRLVTTPIRRSADSGFAVDPEVLTEAVGVDTAFIVVVSPDNPTGHITTPKELADLRSAARESSASVIWDEVFCDLVFSAAGAGAEAGREIAAPAHPLATEDGPPTFVLNGASKLFAAPDVKVGWIVLAGAPRRRAALRERLAVANDHYLSASPFSQAMLPHLFDGLGLFRREMREVVARRRDLFLKWSEEETRVEVIPPEGGVHALCRVRGIESMGDESFALGLLAGDPPVYVHPGSLYGAESTPPAFVVSLLTAEETLKRGLEAVSERITDVRERPGL